jgi:hypothetical protein
LTAPSRDAAARPPGMLDRGFDPCDNASMLALLVIVALIFYAFVSLRVLRQYERGVVFLLGKFRGVRAPGLTVIFVPFQQSGATSSLSGSGPVEWALTSATLRLGITCPRPSLCLDQGAQSNLPACLCGEVAERLKATHLGAYTGDRIGGSNPSPLRQGPLACNRSPRMAWIAMIGIVAPDIIAKARGGPL